MASAAPLTDRCLLTTVPGLARAGGSGGAVRVTLEESGNPRTEGRKQTEADRKETGNAAGALECGKRVGKRGKQGKPSAAAWIEDLSILSVLSARSPHFCAVAPNRNPRPQIPIRNPKSAIRNQEVSHTISASPKDQMRKQTGNPATTVTFHPCVSGGGRPPG